MPDSQGQPYALVAETKEGDWLTADQGFTTIPEGSVVQVYLTTGPSPRLAVTSTLGDHALAGELNPDGTYHGGISDDGLEYQGFYAGEAPSGSE